MANRTFSKAIFSSEIAPTHVYMQVNIGASGAPTIITGKAWVLSMTRNSAGDYTIVFKDNYNSVLGVRHMFNSGSSAPASPSMWLKTDSITSTTSPSLRVVFNTGGTATDPASGEKLYMTFILKNSSV